MNTFKEDDRKHGLSILQEKLGGMVTNIGNIIYTSNEEKLKKFEEITVPFCDNIIVMTICDKEINNKNKSKTLGQLRDLFSGFKLHKGAVKSKVSFPFTGNPNSQMRQIIQQILKDDTEKYRNSIVTLYKIELADIELNALLKDLPELVIKLQSQNFYIVNLDVTQDFAGIFNKTEMCDYLKTKQGFCFKRKEKTDNMFLKNKKAGIDCLTWQNHDTRVKIYNKFICQMTCPGVGKKIGNNIIEFINCRDVRLKEMFASKSAKNHGITRLEATIYNLKEDNNGSRSIRNCLSVLKKNKLYLQAAPFYSVPISSMWRKLTDELKSSCCVVVNNSLQFAYWGNSNTRKLTGLQIDLPSQDRGLREMMITYALSAYSFKQLPLYYINSSERRGNTKPTTKTVCYIKPDGKTFFSRSNRRPTVIPECVKIEDLGLIATNNVIPEVLREKTLYHPPCVIIEIEDPMDKSKLE